MSMLLVVFYNETNENVHFYNAESGGNSRTVYAGTMFRTQRWFNIPDNSDSSRYFDEKHMEIRRPNGHVIFSFWDDDHQGFRIYYCRGTDWRNTTAPMPGDYVPGSAHTVALVLTGSAATSYQLTAHFVENDV